MIRTTIAVQCGTPDDIQLPLYHENPHQSQQFLDELIWKYYVTAI